MIVQMSALIVVILCAIISIFQFLLAIGKPLGYLAFGGKYEKVLPKKLRMMSVIAIGIFIFTSLVVLDLANFISLFLDPLIPTIALWVLAFYFVLNTFTNAVSMSKWEKRIMTPISLIMSIFCFIVVTLA